MEENFKLSTYNVVLLVIAIILGVALPILTIAPGVFLYTSIVARVASYCAMPLLIGWIAFRFSKRNLMLGNVVFTVILLLYAGGHVIESANRVQKYSAAKKVEDARQRVRSTIDDPEASLEAVDEYKDAALDNVEQMARGATGADKEAYRLMQEFATTVREMEQKWNVAVEAMLDPRILDFSLLTSDNEYIYQISTLETYVRSTKEWQRDRAVLIEQLQKDLEVLSEGNQTAREALVGFNRGVGKNAEISENMMNGHVQYGEKMIEILEFLKRGEVTWEYSETDGVLFDEDDHVDRFNALLVELGDIETAIQTYEAQYMQSI